MCGISPVIFSRTGVAGIYLFPNRIFELVNQNERAVAVIQSIRENQDFIYAFCSYLHNILYNMLCKDIIQFFLTYVTSKSYKSSWFYNMLYRKNPVSCNICYITVFGYITGYVPYKKAILHDMPFWNPDPLL